MRVTLLTHFFLIIFSILNTIIFLGGIMFNKDKNAPEVIKQLELERFPQNAGWYKLVLHDSREECSKCEKICEIANSTTMLRLVEKNTISRWTRINSTLIRSFIAGDPLEVSVYRGNGLVKVKILGNDFSANQHPILVLPKNSWSKISSKGEWSLASFLCTPGFEFEHLEIAQEGWSPS